MTLTVLKSTYKKLKPKIFFYRNFKSFFNVLFCNDLNINLSNLDLSNIEYDIFEGIFMSQMDRHAPLKVKYVRANESPFMNKGLRKAVMLRSKLKNKFYHDKNETIKRAFKKQRNLCTHLFRKYKRAYYNKLNPFIVSNNKLFWKKVKPLFSDKTISQDIITFVEKNRNYF